MEDMKLGKTEGKSKTHCFGIAPYVHIDTQKDKKNPCKINKILGFAIL